MPRAASAEERIALRIETSYAGDGIRSARQDNSALGKEAKAAGQELAAAGQAGTSANRTLAITAREAAEAQGKVFITAAQSNAMWKRAGGDFSTFNSLVRQHVAEQKALAAATAVATQEIQRQAAAGSGGVVGASITPAAAAVSRVSAEVGKIPTQARTATNALTMMAMAMASGSGSAQGLAIAAGTAASGLSTLTNSARLAAAASGIGALVTVLSTVMLLMDRATEKSKAFGAMIRASLGDLSGEALDFRLGSLDRAFAEQVQRVAALEKTRRFMGVNFGREILREQGKLDEIMAQRDAALQEALNRRVDAERDASKQRTQGLSEDAQRGKNLLEELAYSHLDLYQRRTLTEETAARLKVEREYKSRIDEIEVLKIHEDEITSLKAAAYRDRAEKLLAIDDEADKKKKVAAKSREDDIAQFSESMREVGDALREAMHRSIIEGDNFIDAATKSLGALAMRRLEMIAIEHGIQSIAHAVFRDWKGAAGHAAVATAAVLAARQVAQIAGLSGGGGGAGGAGGQVWSPQYPRESSGGNVTVVVQMVNPYSKEVINETLYQLKKAGVMKVVAYGGTTQATPAISGGYHG